MNAPRLEAGVNVVAVLVFMASAALTIAWCASMSAMPEMAMPGGWTMSMTWMRMPGQGWLEFAGMFLGMWMSMMVAMMMPALSPELASFHRWNRGIDTRASRTVAFAAGYFGVWGAAGIIAFLLGLAFAGLAMASESLSRATPALAGIVVMTAGTVQFTGWKIRQLACCRHEHGSCPPGPNYRDALRAGARLGMRCVYCCAGLTAVLLVIGVMDLLAMALVTVAISAERLMAARARMARLIGTGLLLGGAMMLSRAVI